MKEWKSCYKIVSFKAAGIPAPLQARRQGRRRVGRRPLAHDTSSRDIASKNHWPCPLPGNQNEENNNKKRGTNSQNSSWPTRPLLWKEPCEVFSRRNQGIQLPRFFTEENLTMAGETCGAKHRDTREIYEGVGTLHSYIKHISNLQSHVLALAWRSAFPCAGKMVSGCKLTHIGRIFLLLMAIFSPDKYRLQRKQTRKQNWRGHLLCLSDAANVSIIQASLSSPERLRRLYLEQTLCLYQHNR